MNKTSKETKLRIARIYANHIITTGDSQKHTAYTYGVSSTTVGTYINYLKDSPNESDNTLYKEAAQLTKLRRWGYNHYTA